MMMLERALADYLKKDEAWQAHKGGGAAAGDSDQGASGGSRAMGPSGSQEPKAAATSAVPVAGRDGQAEGERKGPGLEAAPPRSK
jgi:hypothetical protein